jgi:hypothetical protein
MTSILQHTPEPARNAGRHQCHNGQFSGLPATPIPLSIIDIGIRGVGEISSCNERNERRRAAEYRRRSGPCKCIGLTCRYEVAGR